jgi:Icc-related predicted phosphoesterase
MPGQATLRIAAVADLHCTRTSGGTYQALFAAASQAADILCLCGDLTDYGLPEEAHVLARELASAKVPILAVMGNHDFESGRQDELAEILATAGVSVLDGTLFEHRGVGFAGVKGFGGGFGRRSLAPWGEPAIKAFVREAMEESLKLESALSRLWTPSRVVLLHYAPIQFTVHGEPPETLPFLGSSRLEEPLDRYRVTTAFHGHAHHGAPEGRTKGNVPVYNVSMPLLKSLYPDRPAFRVFEVPSPE